MSSEDLKGIGPVRFKFLLYTNWVAEDTWFQTKTLMLTQV